MEASLKSKKRYYELDLMRFLAAFSVLMYHYTFYTPRMYGSPPFYNLDAVFRYGYLGVDAFFMISGYVVLMSSMHKTPKDFVISRVVRLYPTYWIICIITFCILYFGHISLPNIPHATLKNLAYNLTMLQNFFGKESLNPVFWTLTFEMSFYFLILLISALKLWKNLLLILIIWLLYSLIAGQHSTNSAFDYLFIPKYSCCFISGMLFYLLRIGYADKWKIYALLILSYALNLKKDLFILNNMNGSYHEPGAYNVYALFMIITVFYIFFLFSGLDKINLSGFPFLARLGFLTYPLYLVHPIGAEVLIILAGKLNKTVLLVAVTLIMLWLSRLIYRYIEQPFQPFLKKKLSALLDHLA
jgi:peptidoglycan/LPS O-acetylase OafA/YrhL